MGERHVFGAGPCCSKYGCNKASIEAGMLYLPSQWVSVPRSSTRPTIQVMDGETDAPESKHSPRHIRAQCWSIAPWHLPEPYDDADTCPAPTPRAP